MSNAVRQIGKTETVALQISGVALFLVLWEVSPRLGLLDPQFLPTFSATFAECRKMLLSGVMFTSAMVSLWRALIGLLIAAAVALPLGLWLGAGNGGAVERRIRPLLRLLSQVNPFSLMPVFILFFGIGEIVKLMVVAWVCLWPLLFNAIEGAKNADPALVKTANAMCGGRFGTLAKVILPGASAFIFAGLRVGVGMSFFMLIAAEMLGATDGLGWLLHNSAMNYQIGRIYAASLATIMLSFGLSFALKYLQERLFFWREDALGSHRADGGVKRVALKKWHFGAISAFVVFLLIVGTWQVEVSRQKTAGFNRTVHVHDQHSMPRGGGSE
jgi:NitT/TauT family transport system permease protein